MAFIFYDTETTGVETAFDQILQFAAIKTNDLNELDRLDFRCRLMPHFVLSPGALRVNRVTPAMLADPNLPSHYEAICLIRAKLIEWSPVVFIGYNSISFDEELLRQAGRTPWSGPV
jgi:exodeoxyribonuclease-1